MCIRDRSTSEVDRIETPRGPWLEKRPEDASALLDEILPGQEWGDALATIASLDVAAVAEAPLDTQTTGESPITELSDDEGGPA